MLNSIKFTILVNNRGRRVKLSTRARYGTRALLDLAQHQGNEPVQLKDIASRQNISLHNPAGPDGETEEKEGTGRKDSTFKPDFVKNHTRLSRTYENEV